MTSKSLISRVLAASLVLAALLLVPERAAAQQAGGLWIDYDPDVTVLDLETAIQIAVERSWRMERGRLNLQRDTYNLESSRAALKSNASLDFTIPDFDQSIKEIIDPSSGNPKVLSTKGARYSGSISIRQPLPTDGVVSLNGVMNRSSDELFSYSPGQKSYFGRVFIRLEQPILQPNGIKFDIRRAELRLEQTELSFQDEEIRLVSQISRSYFDLLELTQQDLLIRDEVARLEEMYAIGLRLFESGDISEISLLQLEVDLTSARNDASAIAGRLLREKDDFKQEIGLSLDEEIAVQPSLAYEPFQIDEAGIVAEALERRTDLRRTLIRREEHEMDLRERRSRGALTGEISLTLGLEGRGNDMDRFYDAIWDPDQARGATIKFSIPLWDWGRNEYSVLSKQTDLDQNFRTEEEQQITIRREVQSVVARVEEAEERLGLLQRTVEAADRSFQLALQLFGTAELPVQDILLTQNQLEDARESYLRAYLDYREAQIDLEAVKTASGFGRGGRGFF